MYSAWRSANPSSALAAAVAATAAVSTAVVLARSQQPTHTEADAGAISSSYKIEADLMDKIASKSYIQQRNPNPDKRPRGVPKTMRILAIDLPQMRQAFDGECRVNLKRIFPDGIAPYKEIRQQEKGESVRTIEIMQKSLAKSVVRCRNAKSKRVGVELLEASVAELNPHNMRRTHKFGNFMYDPGKFARHQTEDGSPANPDDEEDTQDNTSVGKTNKHNTPVQMVVATEADELDAPWNQYAWIEELESRVSGYVRFESPMEPSSGFSRVIFGNVYRQEVPSSRKIYEWFLPRFFQRDPSGVDGDGLNWASHKPHAVIANGAAMQRVPGSMKLLADVCKETDVPLYIIHDPRAWGENTHRDLPGALRDMRQTIKGRIVAAVLEEQGGAFTRGRIVGQLETDARWQAKELQRKAQQAIRNANDEYLKGRENDWRKLDAERLKERLAEHGVIVLRDSASLAVSKKPSDEGKKKSGWFRRRRKTDDVPKVGFDATEGMVQLSKECIRFAEGGESTVETGGERVVETSDVATNVTESEDEEIAGAAST